MKDPALFDTPPRSRGREQAQRGRSFVVTWGTCMALITAGDKDAARARVRARSRVPLAGDEIHVRVATRADRRLADEFEFRGSDAQLTDWKYSIE